MGLHWIDISIILLYMLGMLYVGKVLSKNIKGETDFYLAGRKLGKFTQFFLVFGGMTEASSAASVTSVVFRQGASGVWLHLQLIFVTPFYWFFNVWFRRVRLISTGDIFVDRFDSKFLAGMYALYGIVVTTLFVGMGYLASAKTLQAVLVKPESKYTQVEQQSVQDFHDYNVLKEQYQNNELAETDKDRFATLQTRYKQGDIRGYVSYIPNDPILFYLVYGAAISIYVISGGFSAAAITNIFQGILIIVFSIILIPIGLFKLGGFSGLHEKVPEHMFQIVSTVDLSEYNLCSIGALVFLGIVGYCGGTNVMSGSGSAKDELAARVGVVTGAFTKRIMTIAWMLCGLIAIGLFQDTLADADESWGMLTKGLLGVGGIGLMITGILAANMSSMDATSLNISALFVRNIYTPLLPNKPEKHYVMVGRLFILAVLIFGIIVALNTTGIIPLIKLSAAVNAMFGAVVLLAFVWRGLTKHAVIITSVVFLVLVVLIPVVVANVEVWRSSEQLTARTPERIIQTEIPATETDVAEGRAQAAGEMILVAQVVAPAPVYFERVVSLDEDHSEAKLQGQGRFHVEIYLAHLLGLDVENFSKAGLLATRFLVDALVPLLLLIGLSFVTKPSTDKATVDRFYVKMKTPVAPTPEEDEAELEKSYADPTRYDHLKLWPHSNIELCKWTREDAIGFALSWIAVIAIILVLVLCVGWGR